MQTTESNTCNTQAFGETTSNISSNNSFRHPIKKSETFLTNVFGNKQFIKDFWKLLAPSLIWGLISSLVPLLFNDFVAFFFSNGQGFASGNNFYLAITYVYGLFATFNTLVTVFLFAVFPVVGNFAGRRHFKKMRETMRWAIYVGFLSSLILLIFEQAFAAQLVNTMVWLNAPSGNQTMISVHLVRTMSFISFFYLWGWLYVPTLSSIKNTKAIFYSAFLAFVFFIIATPVYLHCITANYNHLDQVQKNNIVSQASYVLGAFYLLYFVIKALLLYGYIKLINPTKAFFNRIAKAHFNINSDEKELQFMKEWKVSGELIKRIIKLSWFIMLDQSLFSIITIVQLVYIINYGGYLPNTHEFILNVKSQSENAASNYYKDITAVAFMFTNFFFGIFNSFAIAPQYFVAGKLGQGKVDEAYQDSWRCLTWSVTMGIVFMLVCFILAYTINPSYYPNPNHATWYQFLYNPDYTKVWAEVTYSQLYADSTIMTVIFAAFMVINTVCSMVFFILISGGSKWIVTGDSLIQIVLTIVTIILLYTHFNNFYTYFIITQLVYVFKTAVCMLLIGYRKGLNYIEYQKIDA